MTLGTAQVGSPYGIANTTGKPAVASANEIFDKAYAHGIKCFDTAPEYGDAEQRIGDWMGAGNRDVSIITKLSKNICANDVEKAIYASRERLNTKTLETLLFRSSEIFLNREFISRLYEIKAAGLVRHLGVSVYTVKEAEQALDVEGIEVLQVPLNIFNWQFARSGFLDQASAAGKVVMARSIFCQGLLLLNEGMVPSSLAEAKPAIRLLEELSRETRFSRIELAVSAVCSVKKISSFVVGAETAEQIDILTSAFNRVTFEKDVLGQLESIGEMVDEFTYDPRNWNN